MPLIETNSEKMLLQRISLGDQRAFALLFEMEHKKINSFALKLTHSKELSEEIVQDVFLKLWLGREKLTEVENWGGYLNRIVRNHCFNVLKRLAQETLLNIELGKRSTEIDVETENGIQFRGTKELIQEAIDSLPPQQQKVYSLCHVEGLKYAEAAERLNIAPGTVQAHMKQALSNIRKYLNRYAPAIIFSASFAGTSFITDEKINQLIYNDLQVHQKIVEHRLPR